MKLIERKQYLKKMINVIGTPDIKVLTGVRRSGKSKLLEAFMQILFTLISIYQNMIILKNTKLLMNISKLIM